MQITSDHRDVGQRTWNGGAAVICACGNDSIGTSFAKAFDKHLKHRKDPDGSHEQCQGS